MATRLGPSLTVLVPLLIISTLVAIGLALGVAYVRGSLTDRAVMIVCTVGLSISILVYIIVFQYFFAYKLGWFPVQGWGDSFWQNLVVYASLPILIGLVVSIAPDLRLFRTFVLDEINQDYVRTARAKGLSENRIMWVHVLRNASIPIITHVMAELPGLLMGAFLIERFFSIPGIGREVILAVERSDFPVIKALTVYVAFATMASQSAGRPDVQGRRSAGPVEVTEKAMANHTASMANDDGLKAPLRTTREIPHTVSPGLWALAWKRLKSDHVGDGLAGDRGRLRADDDRVRHGTHRRRLGEGGRRQLRAAVVRSAPTSRAPRTGRRRGRTVSGRRAADSNPPSSIRWPT